MTIMTIKTKLLNSWVFNEIIKKADKQNNKSAINNGKNVFNFVCIPALYNL